MANGMLKRTTSILMVLCIVLILGILFHFSTLQALSAPTNPPLYPGASIWLNRQEERSTTLLATPSNNEVLSNTLLCRLGLNVASRSLSEYPADILAQLRGGWYFNWGTTLNPPTPNGIRYAQTIFVKQWKSKNGVLTLFDRYAPYAIPYTYTIRPSFDVIQNIARANPGSLWLVGNEIERRDWGYFEGSGQMEILPEVYAKAYHEVYHTIKAADPTAQVANGSIIIPTPLRLKYMTRIWDEYFRLYGEPMPVDVWQIHVYASPEKRDSWGIDIPAGLTETVGMFYYGEGNPQNILVNGDFSVLPEYIRAFRTWMKERGQQSKSLIITEFGVSMPDWVMVGEFTPEKVRDRHMYPGLDYVLNEKDYDIGNPADEYRLVQSTWWWSLDADAGTYDQSRCQYQHNGYIFCQGFNGNLLWSGIGYPTHSPDPMGIAPLGQYWISYVRSLPEQVNLRPLKIIPTSSPYSQSGEPVTITLEIELSNSGSVNITEPFSVTLMNDESQPIGNIVFAGLAGCGTIAKGHIQWENLAPGLHTIRTYVDSTFQIAETKEDDNELIATILVAEKQVYLPLVFKKK